MCAILGASFAPNSKIDRRKLIHHLLDEGERRGTDASGFAWVRGEDSGTYKNNLRGSQLSMSNLPQDAEAVIAHTRAATQGDPKDNRNNHPVTSASGDIRLVHNGVIYNDDELRTFLDRGSELADVDSSVIPGVLEELGLEGTELLAGDATAAWFDVRTGNVLHLARFNHNPIALATLEDGSFVFASTPEILGAALTAAGLRWFGAFPNPFAMVNDGAYAQIVAGEVIETGAVSWNDQYFTRYQYNAAQVAAQRAVTSGATTVAGRGFAPADTAPAVLQSPELDDDEPPISDQQASMWADGFYLIDHGGSYVTYNTLSQLFARLRVEAGRGDSGAALVDHDSGDLRWVNWFEDIGEFQVKEGGNTQEISWLAEPIEMELWGSAIPPFVKDGVDVLRKVSVV